MNRLTRFLAAGRGLHGHRIADNKTAELFDWDYELLPIELADLDDTGFDLDLLGFGGKELVQLLECGVTAGLTDPDEVPEPPALFESYGSFGK